jgi:hypothetical protein
MIKPLFVAALYVLAHDEQHLSDWIGENKLKDPYTNDECCGPRDFSETTEGHLAAGTRDKRPKGAFAARERRQIFSK